MIKKFDIDYTIFPQHNQKVQTYRTDDPVETEEFLMHLLASGARIVGLKHEGVPLEDTQADRMLKIAVERLCSRMLVNALDTDSTTIHRRFGFVA